MPKLPNARGCSRRANLWKPLLLLGWLNAGTLHAKNHWWDEWDDEPFPRAVFWEPDFRGFPAAPRSIDRAAAIAPTPAAAGESVIFDDGQTHVLVNDDTFSTIIVGDSHSATLVQRDHTIQLTDSLDLAEASGSSGTYRMSGGSLVANGLDVGVRGTGTVVQTGGIITIGGGGNSGFTVALGGQGTYTLSAGTLFCRGGMVIGDRGTGTFNQTGGVFDGTGSPYNLDVGGQGGTGTVNLSGNGVFGIAGGINIGANLGSQGVFNQSGNSFVSTSGVSLGGLNATGEYNLNGGTLQPAIGISCAFGTGVFNFNGGTLQAINDLQHTNFNAPFFFVYPGSRLTLNVRDGGAIIDLQTFDNYIATALTHSKIAGDNPIDGGLTKLGTATLTLTGVSTYTGPTHIDAGTLAIGTGGSLGDTDIFVRPGTSLLVTDTGLLASNTASLLVDGTAANPATATLSGTGASTRGKVMVALGTNSAGTVVQSGGSSLTVNPANVFAIAVGSGSTGAYMLGDTASLTTGETQVGVHGVGAFTQTGGTFTTNGQALYIGLGADGSGTYTLNDGTLRTGLTQVSENGNTSSFTQSGGTHVTDILSLSDNSAASRGTYNLDSGLLAAIVVTSGTTGARGTSTFNFNGGTLRARENNPAFFHDLTTANVRDGGAIIDSFTFNVTMAQGLVHSTVAGDSVQDGGLTKNGSGGLTLTGANTYTGPTTVNAGTLTFGAGGGLSGGGPINVGAGASLVVTGNAGVTAPAGVTIGSTAGDPASGSLSGSASLSTGTVSIGGLGAGSFSQTGTDTTLTTNGGNLYVGYGPGANGTYTLNSGTLTTGNTVVGNDTNVSAFTQNGGTHHTSSLLLGIGGGAGTYTLTAGNLNVDGAIQPGNTGPSTGNGIGTGTFNQRGGIVTAAGGVFLAVNTNTAGTYNLENSGNLVTNAVTGGSGTSAFYFNGGLLRATADFNNFISGLTTLQIRNGTATIDSNGHNIAINQSFNHSTLSGDNAIDGGLNKLGAGRLTLAGNNTYTGNTRVFAGTLFVGGSITSPSSTVVSSGATLGGNGFNQGNVFILAGGTLAPSQAGGLSAARLTLGSSLSLPANSLLSINLAGSLGGTGYDTIELSGSLTLGGNLSVRLSSGFTPTLGERFFILDDLGLTLTSGAFANGTALGPTTGLFTDGNGNSFLVNYADHDPADASNLLPNDVSLTYLGVNVPEPSTWAWLAIGVGLLVVASGRRNRSVSGTR